MRSATTIKRRTGSEGAGILAKAGSGGVPPLRALLAVLAVATDRRRSGVSARDAMVTTTFKGRGVLCVVPLVVCVMLHRAMCWFLRDDRANFAKRILTWAAYVRYKYIYHTFVD